jgi:Caspase domain
MWVRLAVALVALLGPATALAQTPKRIAVLIGNRAYDASVGVLRNPHNDITVVGEALAKQGFEVLPPIKDARRSAILSGVRELVRKLNAAGTGAIGLLYYSGHGAAERDTNINYLIPVDAREPGTSSFWDESVKLEDILKLLDGARAAAKFVIFDACRNELQLPTKDTSKGLVPVSEQQGMFIAYASAPGRTASDRGERSGPYAAALAAELAKPGNDHLSLFQNVKEAVYAASGGAQQPWESNGLLRRVYLSGQQPELGQPQVPLASERLSEAAEVWDRTKDATSIPVLEAFAVRYGATFYADLARSRIDDLKKQQQSVAGPSIKQQPTSSAQMLRCESHAGRSACELDTSCAWADANQQCQRKIGSLSVAALEAATAAKSGLSPPASSSTSAGGYEVNRFSSLTGPTLASHTISVDAAKPDPAVESCARLCNSHIGCSAFDISLVYGKCTLYRSVEKSTPLGGYISGIKPAR